LFFSAWINQNCNEASAGIANKTSYEILFPTHFFGLDERPNLQNNTGLEAAVFSAQVEMQINNFLFRIQDADVAPHYIITIHV